MKRCEYCSSECENGICEGCMYINNHPDLQSLEMHEARMIEANERAKMIREIEIEVESLRQALDACMWKAQAKRIKRVLDDYGRELKRLRREG